MNKYLSTIALLTLAGIVGLYVIGYLAYKKYQPVIGQITGDATKASGLLKSIFG